VIVRHHVIKAKRIEKLLLVSVVPPHHRPPPATDHISVGESPFAGSFKRLLQQNRPEAESA
jgi:hypothetical protein